MASDNEFTVLDLFAGAGGLSEGFFRTGYNFLSHIDKDKNALMTLETRAIYHALNAAGLDDIYWGYLKGQYGRQDFLKECGPFSEQISKGIIELELTSVTREKIVSKIDKCRMNSGTKNIDLIIGGPPCQAYSIVGRSRDPQRMQNDTRNYLYRYYLELLKYFKPSIFVFENVPGMRSAKGGEIYESFKRRAMNCGYIIEDKILDSQDFFVLQKRKRLIVIGWRSEYDLEYPSFKPVDHSYIVSDLLSDLPPLNPGDGSDSFQSYMGPPTEYLVRAGIRSKKDVLIQHSARTHNDRDKAIYRHAITAWFKDHRRLKYDELPEELKTHNNRKSFKDRFKVVEADRSYSHTILAHISRDGHYYIHPDINQSRSLTSREAARIQSFPDNYKFEGSKKSQYRQIGNAVPPLMAEGIAHAIKGMLVSL
jgi:DNA (cytosine-5)-methyltransferase 1